MPAIAIRNREFQSIKSHLELKFPFDRAIRSRSDIGDLNQLIFPAKSALVVRACTFKAPLCVGGALINYPHPQFETGMTWPAWIWK